MRGNIRGLLAVVLMCVCGVARATPIVYNVNVSDGIETVSGTITTDGMIGTLVAGDITAWNLTATGPVAFSINSTLPAADVFCTIPSDCGLTASAAALVYDFINPLFGITFEAQGTTTISRDLVIFGPSAVTITIQNTLPFPRYFIISPPATIAAASVPEPGTYALLGIAMAGLGYARKRSLRSIGSLRLGAGWRGTCG